MNWDIVLLVGGGITGLATLYIVITDKAGELPAFRSYRWYLPLLLIWTGDAVVGDAREPLERIAKGVVATLLWLSVAIVLWRRRRHRIATAKAAPAKAAPPEATPVER